MKCDITLYIGAEEIVIPVSSDSLPSSDEELILLIMEKGKLEEVLKAVNAKLKLGEANVALDKTDYISHIRQTDSGNILVTVYAIPNMNGNDLKRMFPGIAFPDGNLAKYKIQLVNKYTQRFKDGNPIYGIARDSKGNDVIIIDNDPKHLLILANYFTARTKIEEQGILDSILNDTENEDNPLLEAIMDNARDGDEPINLIVNFLENKNKFRGGASSRNKYVPKSRIITVKYKTEDGTEIRDEMTFFRALDTLCSHIVDGYKIAFKFKDPVINTLNESLRYKDYSTGTISKKEFINIILGNGIQYNSEEEIILNLGTLFGWSEEEIRNVFGDEKKGKIKDHSSFVKFFNQDINDIIFTLNNLFTNFLKREGKRYLNEAFDPNKKEGENNKKYKGTGWDVLFDVLQEREPRFAKRLSSSSGNYLKFKSFFPTLKSAYGYGFEKVLNLEPMYFKGTYILKIDDKYFVMDYYTTENQWTARFDNLDEAKKYINERDRTISKDSFIGLNLKGMTDEGVFFSDDLNDSWVHLSKYVEPQTIVTVVDYDVPNVNSRIYGTLWEDYMFGDKTVDDFGQFILKKKNEIRDLFDDLTLISFILKLNTPNKIALFISQLFNPRIIKYEGAKSFSPFLMGENVPEEIKQLTRERIKQIVDDIYQAPLKHFFIHALSKNNTANVIVMKGNTYFELYRGGNRTYPITSLWRGVQRSLLKKGLPLPVRIISLEDINNYNEGKSEEEKINERAKAFISSKDIFSGKEGLTQIYINVSRARTTDLYHEYIHLTLGVLKLLSPESYKLLMTKIWESGKEDEIKKIQISYRGWPREAIMEEFFVKKFTDVVLKNKGKLEDFLNTELKETYLLFTPNASDLNFPLVLKELSRMSVQDVLMNFNHDVAMYLLNGTIQSSLTPQSLEDLKMDRRKLNWIREQIRNKKLIENCE